MSATLDPHPPPPLRMQQGERHHCTVLQLDQQQGMGMGNSVTRSAVVWPDVHTHSKQLNAFMSPKRLFSWGTKPCSSKANRLNSAHSSPPLLIYTDTNVHVETISRSSTWDKKCLIICRKRMATRRESTLHNNHREPYGKHLNTSSFVFHKKEQSLTEVSSVRSIWSLTFAGQMCCWCGAHCRTTEQKSLDFISSTLLFFTSMLILFNNIISWVPRGKLHRYCPTGSQHRVYDHLSTLQVTGCIFQKLMNWPQWHGGSTCSFRENKS